MKEAKREPPFSRSFVRYYNTKEKGGNRVQQQQLDGYQMTTRKMYEGLLYKVTL